jgi:hypothetical protein
MMSGMLTLNGLSRLGPETSFEIFKLGELSSVSGAGLPPHSMVTHQKKNRNVELCHRSQSTSGISTQPHDVGNEGCF